MAEYVPSANPRWLGADPFEIEKEQTQAILEQQEIDHRIQTTLEIKDTFESKGWQHVHAYLREVLDETQQSILQGIGNREKEQKFRGRREALNILLGYPSFNDTKHNELLELLHEPEPRNNADTPD